MCLSINCIEHKHLVLLRLSIYVQSGTQNKIKQFVFATCLYVKASVFHPTFTLGITRKWEREIGRCIDKYNIH